MLPGLSGITTNHSYLRGSVVVEAILRCIWLDDDNRAEEEEEEEEDVRVVVAGAVMILVGAVPLIVRKRAFKRAAAISAEGQERMREGVVVGSRRFFYKSTSCPCFGYSSRKLRCRDSEGKELTRICASECEWQWQWGPPLRFPRGFCPCPKFWGPNVAP